MKIRTIAIASVALGLLTACPMPMPVLVPDGVRSADCATGPGARCEINVRSGGSYMCEGRRFDVDPDFIRMRGNRPVNIFWSLPEGFAFCGQDGVYLNAAISGERRQVAESFGSDSADGSRVSNSFVAANCSTKWHWNYNNTGTSTYKYSIQFTHKASGRTCTIDPWIKNGNS